MNRRMNRRMNRTMNRMIFGSNGLCLEEVHLRQAGEAEKAEKAEEQEEEEEEEGVAARVRAGEGGDPRVRLEMEMIRRDAPEGSPFSLSFSFLFWIWLFQNRKCSGGFYVGGGFFFFFFFFLKKSFVFRRFIICCVFFFFFFFFFFFAQKRKFPWISLEKWEFTIGNLQGNPSWRHYPCWKKPKRDSTTTCHW